MSKSLSQNFKYIDLHTVPNRPFLSPPTRSDGNRNLHIMEVNTNTNAQTIAELKEKQLMELEKLIEDNKKEFDNNLLLQESLILLHGERIEALKKQHKKDEDRLMFNEDTLKEFDKINKRCSQICETLHDCETESNILDRRNSLNKCDDGSIDVSYEAYLQKINEVKHSFEQVKIEQLQRPLFQTELEEINSYFKMRKDNFWKKLQQNSLITNPINVTTVEVSEGVLEKVYDLAKKIMAHIVQIHIQELKNLIMIQRFERLNQYDNEEQVEEIKSVTNAQTSEIQIALNMFDKLEAKAIDFNKFKDHGTVKHPECIELQITGAISAQKILAEEFKIEEKTLSNKVSMELKHKPYMVGVHKQELKRFYQLHKCKFKALVKTLIDTLANVNRTSSTCSINDLKELVCSYYDVNACSSVQIHFIDSQEYTNVD